MAFEACFANGLSLTCRLGRGIDARSLGIGTNLSPLSPSMGGLVFSFLTPPLVHVIDSGLCSDPISSSGGIGRSNISGLSERIP